MHLKHLKPQTSGAECRKDASGALRPDQVLVEKANITQRAISQLFGTLEFDFPDKPFAP